MFVCTNLCVGVVLERPEDDVVERVVGVAAHEVGVVIQHAAVNDEHHSELPVAKPVRRRRQRGVGSPQRRKQTVASAAGVCKQGIDIG